jgi:hypothetical protein
VNTREECHWSHACSSFKRAGVGTNGILECKFLSKNAHRALSVSPTTPIRIVFFFTGLVTDSELARTPSLELARTPPLEGGGVCPICNGRTPPSFFNSLRCCDAIYIQQCATEFMVSNARALKQPSVLRHNLQCQPVRGANAREECHWPHACKSLKRAKAWDPMASSSVNFCLNTRTAQ